jgi:FkbM family methyltransferase
MTMETPNAELPNSETRDSTETLTNSLQQQVTVFKADHISDHIKKYGLHEKEKLQVINKILQRFSAPVVLDIGANIGNHALAFSTVAGHVHAFEPIPAVHALLAKNIEQNAITNITAHKLALSDTQGSDTIYMVSEGNIGMSSFDNRESTSIPVEVTKETGDNFLARQHISKVDLIKIDVEAHEYFVVKGLMQTIRAQMPVITLEWNDPVAIDRFNDTEEFRFLQENYLALVIGINHDRTYWRNKPFAWLKRKGSRLFMPRKAVIYDFNPAWNYDNVLFVPKGREALLENIR